MSDTLFHGAALIAAGLFAGGTMMESVVGHPARLAAGDVAGIEVMQRVLERADPYMPVLALAGAGTAIASYVFNGSTADLAAGLLLAAMVPFTIFAIVATNKTILAHSTSAGATNEVLLLMHRWKRRHAVRSVAGLAALTLLALGLPI